jgi:hypothetical protein
LIIYAWWLFHVYGMDMLTGKQIIGKSGDVIMVSANNWHGCPQVFSREFIIRLVQDHPAVDLLKLLQQSSLRIRDTDDHATF